MKDEESTTQGITIDRNYLKNIPVPGRTFSGVLGAAPGTVSFSGSTSIENRYYVDGVVPRDRGRGAFRVKADVMSALAQDYIAASLSRSAFLGDEEDDEDVDDRAPATRAVVPPEPPRSPYAAPHTGALYDVTRAIATGDRDHALEIATGWQLSNPGDVAALIGLGEAAEARGETALAARAYASILDLYPNRAELLRAAGERLDRVDDARSIAIDAYRRAVAERTDQARRRTAIRRWSPAAGSPRTSPTATGTSSSRSSTRARSRTGSASTTTTRARWASGSERSR